MKSMIGMRGRLAVEEIRRRKMEEEFQSFARGEEARQLVERAKSGEAIDPGAFLKLSIQGFPGQEPMPDDPKTVARMELIKTAYEAQIGLFFETLPDGFRMLDFAEMIDGAMKIDYARVSDTISVDRGNYVLLVTGKAVIPFLRYLRYLGIFQVNAARVPCPDCGEKEPCDCETCGGLGWIIPEVTADV